MITLQPSDSPARVPPLGAIAVLCTATGVPTPTVKWILENGDVVDGGALQLQQLTRDTVATCTAENNAGKTNFVLQILISGDRHGLRKLTLKQEFFSLQVRVRRRMRS